MVTAFFNYPNTHVTIHKDSSCPFIHLHGNRKTDRSLSINLQNLLEVISDFKGGKFRFAATQELNDFWIQVDFGDADFEIALINYLLRIISTHYKPFRGIVPAIHC